MTVEKEKIGLAAVNECPEFSAVTGIIVGVPVFGFTHIRKFAVIDFFAVINKKFFARFMGISSDTFVDRFSV